MNNANQGQRQLLQLRVRRVPRTVPGSGLPDRLTGQPARIPLGIDPIGNAVCGECIDVNGFVAPSSLRPVWATVVRTIAFALLLPRAARFVLATKRLPT